MCSDNNLEKNVMEKVAFELINEPTKPKVPTAEEVASIIESRGWKRSIALDEDFNAAVDAVRKSIANRLGVIVGGEYGCGKTSLMNAILPRKYLFRINLGDREDLKKLDPNWQDWWGVHPNDMHVYLDDLGAEPLTSDYGSYGEMVADFIVQWHLHHHPKCYMFISTNLKVGELDNRYGGRLVSRLKDICVPLRLKGEDKREWKL